MLPPWSLLEFGDHRTALKQAGRLPWLLAQAHPAKHFHRQGSGSNKVQLDNIPYTPLNRAYHCTLSIESQGIKAE